MFLNLQYVVLEKSSQNLLIKPFDNPLEHLTMDEFRSVKTVTSLMSFVFINNDTHKALDVLEN